MKKIIFSLIVICLSQMAIGQTTDTTLSYIKNPVIPAFKIYKTPDSTLFTNEDLKPKHAFMLILFNPDCEHCQKETKELIAYKEELKDVQIVMASSLPYERIKAFYEEYGLANLPNFIVAQDRAYAFGTIYRPTNFPSIYLYDKNGKFITWFKGNVAIPDILQAFK